MTELLAHNATQDRASDIKTQVLVSYLGIQERFDIEIAVQRSRAGPSRALSPNRSKEKQGRRAGGQGKWTRFGTADPHPVEPGMA